jgi:aryl-alcohol dehydrogenase-like predicted oxidoreductase
MTPEGTPSACWRRLYQGLSRHHILGALEGSLRRVDTDYIDVYIVHRLDRLTPLEETLETLNDAVRAGKIRYGGFSKRAGMAGGEIGGATDGPRLDTIPGGRFPHGKYTRSKKSAATR